MKCCTKSNTSNTDDGWVPPPQGQWTYDDYARLPDREGFRYEVIRGRVYLSPAQRTVHQRIVLKLARLMSEYVEQRGLGEVFICPLDVTMSEVATPVQPDVLFVSKAKASIVEELYIRGVPDLLVEVLSPSRPSYDRVTKFKAYLDVGVPEYWIIDPSEKTVEVNVLREDFYATVGPFKGEQQVRSEVLPAFAPKVAELFE